MVFRATVNMFVLNLVSKQSYYSKVIFKIHEYMRLYRRILFNSALMQFITVKSI